eukprot:TRINITY_DN33_c0_g1_i1.p1 TRINITY_DN33_c0_g1~~TRINITY_DN33_c0_g1_i1.p1  ORF type:complete len:300 (+),score=112.00 TRINITY_DN33_c0_g1_i1:116-1015(+)
MAGEQGQTTTTTTTTTTVTTVTTTTTTTGPAPKPDRGWRCAADGRRFAAESETQQAARGIVNKLTQLTFDSMVAQMAEMVNSFVAAGDEQSEKKLDEVVGVLYDIAIESDGPRDKHLGVLYARFHYAVCQQEALATAARQGTQPLIGPTQFRKKMVARLQSDFERCQEQLASGGHPDPKTLRRLATGNVNFLAQLFNQKLVTEKTVGQVCRTLLLGGASADDPEVPPPTEENLELLFELLRAAGPQLDSLSSAQGWLEPVFAALERLSKDDRLSTRCRFRITDVIELRARRWQDRRASR